SARGVFPACSWPAVCGGAARASDHRGPVFDARPLWTSPCLRSADLRRDAACRLAFPAPLRRRGDWTDPRVLRGWGSVDAGDAGAVPGEDRLRRGLHHPAVSDGPGPGGNTEPDV